MYPAFRRKKYASSSPRTPTRKCVGKRESGRMRRAHQSSERMMADVRNRKIIGEPGRLFQATLIGCDCPHRIGRISIWVLIWEATSLRGASAYQDSATHTHA